MRRWLRIAVPLGIAAVLVSVLAIGFGSPNSLAAPGGKNGEDVSSVDGCNGSMTTKGRLDPGGSAQYQATFCSAPEYDLYVWLEWGRGGAPDRDLALLVTTPGGGEYFVDNDNSFAEYLIVHGPLAEGTWQIEVMNQGTSRVKYEVRFGFA